MILGKRGRIMTQEKSKNGKKSEKMKVIAFWSYKGGTGRSLACANTAYALAKMGYNVAVIDADIEAPGLLFKFFAENYPGDAKSIEDIESDRKKIFSRGGWIDILLDRIKSPMGGISRTIKDISSYIEICDGCKIHLIPAGNHESKEYWENIEKHRFLNSFLLLPDQDFREPIERIKLKLGGKLENEQIDKLISDIPEYLTLEVKKSIFQTIKQEIEELDPHPDFLLIDVRSGINEIRRVVIKLWTDKIVTIFTPNEEQINSFENRDYPQFTKGQHTSDQSYFDYHFDFGLETLSFNLNVIPVITRFQPQLYNYIESTIDRLNKKFNWPNDFLCRIHEDRHMELFDDIALMVERTTIHPYIYRQICNDYIMLIANILTEKSFKYRDEWVEERRRHIEEIQSILGILEEPVPQQAALLINYVTGELVNEGDFSRNISFKVDTFDSLLSYMRKYLEDSLPYLKEERIYEAFIQTLERSGNESGLRFGQTLRNYVWLNYDQYSDVEKVNKWCEFDSRVGWGRFVPFDISGKELPISFEIRVINNPFAENRTEEDTDLCPFLSGYIHGVLTRILDRDERSITVSHELKDCFRIHKNKGRGCIFRVDLNHT